MKIRRDEALAALRTAPGPAPWYLRHPSASIATADGALVWRSADEDRGAGKSLLTTFAGDVVAVADFHCYVKPLAGGRLLVWYEEEEGTGVLLRPSIRLRVFDLARLHPIPDVEACFALLGAQSRFHAASGELASAALSTALDDGLHHVALPPALADAGELLVLAHSTAHARRGNDDDAMHLCLWILDASSGRLEIVPQDWFNRGNYDFEYQWVTRVARLGASGDIVGEGIRLGVFRLDRSKRRIAEWLSPDVFFHPER